MEPKSTKPEEKTEELKLKLWLCHMLSVEDGRAQANAEVFASEVEALRRAEAFRAEHRGGKAQIDCKVDFCALTVTVKKP